ncbi:hypothetical protein PBT90_04995 [Algoriphagus halophytocola]|uniref:Uncharacterized protein n=1 Tax=Algoriphagus halophytocola TaxID=2991499 RepID=A0ABY6MH17_9BACT|nr:MULTISPECIES: hypothetical protein [unclassified Algoriphagus]UZD22774.1 hypothetical protein OM944_19255 [Algoriphagus sp. TR-M5]WBL44040.1 hypothetical protein PBT90_04995 [Algoriphagus sp. TR-M9]
MAKLRNLSITTPLLFAFPLKSTWAINPVDINRPIMDGDWDEAGSLKFSRGFIMAKNDANFLYLTLDVVEDTGNDPSTNDYFWLSFDNNRDRSITSNVDVNYGLYPGQANKLGKQKYLGPGRWTGLLSDPSNSAVVQEFGPSPNSEVSHRIWKFRIELSEINVALSWPLSTPYTYFGFRVKSSNPGFTTDFPGGFYKDFTKLRQLILSRKPSIPSKDLGPIIGSVGLIPTTKINAQGRATTDSGYYRVFQNAAFGGTLNLIGNRAKMQSLYSAGNIKYMVQIAPPGGGLSKLISNWSNYRWNGSTYVLESFAPSAYGYYQLANPAKDYSIDDLLIQFPTSGLLPGLYTVKVTFYIGTSYSVLETQEVKLYIDNHVPATIIESIRHGSSEVSACAIEKIGANPDGLNFRITANDPEGNLREVSFYATYGEGQSASIYSESYDPSKGNWSGFTNQLIPASGNWRPPQSCAYSFILTATARTTNGYSWIGKNTIHRNLTLLLG